jgi:hypothetical protein
MTISEAQLRPEYGLVTQTTVDAATTVTGPQPRPRRRRSTRGRCWAVILYLVFIALTIYLDSEIVGPAALTTLNFVAAVVGAITTVLVAAAGAEY